MSHTPEPAPSGIAVIINKCWDTASYNSSFDPLFKSLNIQNPAHTFQRLTHLRNTVISCCLSKQIFATVSTALFNSFDPERAFNNMERLIQATQTPGEIFHWLHSNSVILPRLMAIFAGSQYLADLLLRDITRIQWLSAGEPIEQPYTKEWLSNNWRDSDRGLSDPEDRLTNVRLFKKRHYLRIGLRDLLRVGFTCEILKELSLVADVCIQAVYEICRTELETKYGKPMESDPDGNLQPCSFAVIGLGKLGGEELNFSSDVDIMFLYSSDEGETTGNSVKLSRTVPKISNHEFYTKLSQAITTALSAVTEDSSIFRVDLRLRPEGSKGDIAYSLRSYEIYYESWGETWERQALIKARTIAGDQVLGEQFIDSIRPFIYRKYLDFSAIEEIRRIKERIDRNLISKQKDKDNVKLGSGGIREIEFIVQSLQLLYGGQDPLLRDSNTLKALDRLIEKQFIDPKDGKFIIDAYIFLRELENRIQITFSLQTYIIPQNERDQAILARKMGISGDSTKILAKKLLTLYEHQTRTVRNIYESFFYHAETTGGEESEILFEEESYHSTLESLRRMNFKDPVHAYNQFFLLREGTPLSHTSTRSKQIFDRLAPNIVSNLRKLPDPDLGLNNLVRFIDSSGSRESFFGFLIENFNLLELLLTLFGVSKYLSDILILHPESLGEIIDPAQWSVPKSYEQLQTQLNTAVSSAPDWESKLIEMRRFKRIEELRIGLRDFSYSPDISITFRNLSDLAEIYLKCAVDIVLKDLTIRFGVPKLQDPPGSDRPCELAIIALGKLGGQELDFGSDLDLILLYSGEGMTTGGESAPIPNYTFINKFWEKFFESVSSVTTAGTGYKIDLRLRPEGKKGSVVQPLSGFSTYFTSRGETWERLALTRARPIAGSFSLGQAFMELVSLFVYESSFTDETVSSIQHIRKRMEMELAKEAEGRKDLKLGYGGTVDIDFIVQTLQLSHGRQFPQIKQTNTLRAILIMQQLKVLSDLEGAILQDAYQFLRRIENRLRIVHDQSIHTFSSTPEEIAPLARRLDYQNRPPYSAADQLLDDYRRHTQNVRNIYNTIFQRLP